MKTTIKHLLIAQEYSDVAKGFDYTLGHYLHFRKIDKIVEQSQTSDQVKDRLYTEKAVYLNKAMKSASKNKIQVVYDPNEGCIYFEMPFGQVSFHLFDDCWLTENVQIIEDYEWMS